eukprot:TRINITY_DN59767_c0_g1_i1.p2 TRINITY_DN59767_c0_g1~~TRINITY_DN59767_c0_g1_i1.p2  ORF type:complete len:136 (-),score=26.67 TRINITY_DN59767_c0_g1_i1:72-446(-)
MSNFTVSRIPAPPVRPPPGVDRERRPRSSIAALLKKLATSLGADDEWPAWEAISRRRSTGGESADELLLCAIGDLLAARKPAAAEALKLLVHRLRARGCFHDALTVLLQLMQVDKGTRTGVAQA